MPNKNSERKLGRRVYALQEKAEKLGCEIVYKTYGGVCIMARLDLHVWDDLFGNPFKKDNSIVFSNFFKLYKTEEFEKACQAVAKELVKINNCFNKGGNIWDLY